MPTLSEVVIETVSNILKVKKSELNENSSPDTVENWDSLRHVHVILALEERFGVSFAEEEVLDIFTVKSIVEVLQRKHDLSKGLSE
jgi:acyl carrier protein